MKHSCKRVVAATALALGLSAPAFAQWSLSSDKSSLHFLSTKNAQVTEVHQFHSLSGSVSQDGKLNVDVDLASVDTSIEIRDTRMKELLFKVADNPRATFTAALPQPMMAMEAGDTMTGEVKGSLTLHGESMPASFMVRASKLSDETLTVSTVAPTLIEADNFSLVKGLKELQSIAGLNSITTTVPVTFSVVFSQ
ncbi:YceI family protein [Alteromonas halophila]|uniref:Lipid/polyisoprenoid-binding YceI-like domain-containing protein n=1 Tax=Alteromonas halophila TaxID=516698 RepID=A0A918JPM1_9ALTE|nr:YceI family protein [Alteromonas halophila]GGW90818.1 hypothetical protein GCM10007391_26390 [Alteromonas halophila]